MAEHEIDTDHQTNDPDAIDEGVANDEGGAGDDLEGEE
jgi:hypothetical protein